MLTPTPLFPRPIAWCLRRLLSGSDRERAAALRDEAQRLASTYGIGRAVVATLDLRRDGAVWTVRRGETVVRLPDSRGLTYLAELVRNPGRDISALQLAAAANYDGATPPAPPSRSSSDPILDDQARAAYRRRLRDLQEDIDEASSWNDTGRLARLETERDFLLRELASAVGLGGRARRFSSDAEKGRVNVTRAIRWAIGKITAAAPDLGEHLNAAVSTGYNCRYEPSLTSTARV